MTPDGGLQPERTRLSWWRTGLCLAAAALLVARLSLDAGGIAFVLAGGGVALAMLWWLALLARASSRDGLPDGRLPSLVAMTCCSLAVVELVRALA